MRYQMITEYIKHKIEQLNTEGCYNNSNPASIISWVFLKLQLDNRGKALA